MFTECKSPSSSLGHTNLPGGTVAQQGSAAYFDYVLRHDTALQDTLVQRPDLVQGLLDGRIGVRYQEARALPDGRGRTTVFDTGQLDTRTVFADVFGQ